jgi:hypothetical protein
MNVTPPEIQAENCSLCGELPDDLTVNTGREQKFPAAFYKLTPVGTPRPGRGQWVGSQLHRCPDCGTYFDWGDYPQVYGSGNCDEERLIRLSPRASRLLNNLFFPDPKVPPDSGDVGQYFEALSPDLLLRGLSSQAGTSPNIVTPFVPHLMRLLCESDDTSVRNSIGSLLGDYVSDSWERAKEIETAQALHAFTILEKHFARADAVIKHDGLPTSWFSFSWLFYVNISEFLRQGSHSATLTELLAELVAFTQACSGKYFTDNLFELLERFDPPNSWLKPYLPAQALAKISELDETRWQRQEDDRRRADEMYY